MKRTIGAVAVLLILSSVLKAQEVSKVVNKQERGFFNLTELGYFYGGNDRRVQIGPSAFKSTFDEVSVYSIRNISGLFLTNKIALGLGFGLDGIQINTGTFYNTFQLFGDARYYFRNEEETFFTYADLGSAVPIDHGFKKGLTWGIGGGYKFMVANRTAMTAGIGYNEQYIVTTPTDKQRIPAIALKVGLMF